MGFCHPPRCNTCWHSLKQGCFLHTGSTPIFFWLMVSVWLQLRNNNDLALGFRRFLGVFFLFCVWNVSTQQNGLNLCEHKLNFALSFKLCMNPVWIFSMLVVELLPLLWAVTLLTGGIDAVWTVWDCYFLSVSFWMEASSSELCSPLQAHKADVSVY